MTSSGVHTRLDDLQGHAPPHRLLLFGHEDYPTTALPDLLQQLVPANPVPWLFAQRLSSPIQDPARVRGLLQEVAHPLAGPQQFLDAAAQFLLPGASLFEVSATLLGRQTKRLREHCRLTFAPITHAMLGMVQPQAARLGDATDPSRQAHGHPRAWPRQDRLPASFEPRGPSGSPSIARFRSRKAKAF
jgi:hypothetical protein